MKAHKEHEDEEKKETKKKHVNHQQVVNSMKVNYEMTIGENKELDLKMDEQQH